MPKRKSVASKASAMGALKRIRKLRFDLMEIPLEYVPPGHEALADQRNFGMADVLVGSIHVDDSLGPRATLEVLIHEITHVILARRCPLLGSSEENNRITEAVCDAMGVGLTELFARNQEFWLNLLRVYLEEGDGEASTPKDNSATGLQRENPTGVSDGVPVVQRKRRRSSAGSGSKDTDAPHE